MKEKRHGLGFLYSILCCINDGTNNLDKKREDSEKKYDSEEKYIGLVEVSDNTKTTEQKSVKSEGLQPCVIDTNISKSEKPVKAFGKEDCLKALEEAAQKVSSETAGIVLDFNEKGEKCLPVLLHPTVEDYFFKFLYQENEQRRGKDCFLFELLSSLSDIDLREDVFTWMPDKSSPERYRNSVLGHAKKMDAEIKQLIDRIFEPRQKPQPEKSKTIV